MTHQNTPPTGQTVAGAARFQQSAQILSPIEAFRSAMVAAGLTPPDDVVADGKFHRFSSNGKPRDDSGWYFLHLDGIPAGSFGCWREGFSQSWCSKSPDAMTPAEREAHHQRVDAMRKAREADQHQRQQQAAQTAATRWQAATPATEHTYLTAKGVKSYGLKAEGDALLIPMWDTAGKLHSLQVIDPEGGKRFQYGGRVKGCYFAIGKPDGVLIVCEGYATGASIHQATGQAVAVAFNAGNLLDVAQALRSKYPALRLILAADDDHLTAGNPGMTKATEAARAVGGLLATPRFPQGRGDKDTDFNDLHKLVGLDAVKACIDAAASVAAIDASTSSSTGQTFPPLAEVTDEAPDSHRNAPKPHPDCLYGLVGDVARTARAANQEVNEYAAALAFMTVLSAGLGRGCYLPIGDDWHHPRLFALHIGRSGRGRKGTSTKLAARILRDLEDRHPDVKFQSHTGGLSSREGLVMKIHDGFTIGKNEVEPIHDKRLWILESEFANVLHQSGRDGNTLSAALRDAWDGTCIKPATKTAPVYASKPHINLLGHVTPSELLDLMKARELSNGFANRFMMIWAEQPAFDPMPGYTSGEVVSALAERTAEVLRFAQSDRFVEGDQTRLTLSHEAAERYKALYRGELQDRSGGERVAGLLVRRAPYLMRLAMLFALADRSTVIDLHHLEVAMHWVRYWVDSVRFVFASAAEEEASEKAQAAADRILAHLDTVPEATRTELVTGCFGRHINKTEMDAAITELLTTSPPAIEVVTRPRPGGGGSGTKVYKKTAAKCANSAKSGSGLHSDAENRSVRSLRTLRNEVPDKNTPPPDFAHFADFASDANSGETQARSQTSHISQTSHGVCDVAPESTEDVEVL